MNQAQSRSGLTSVGGLISILNFLKDISLNKKIDSLFPERPKRSIYKYSDAFRALICLVFSTEGPKHLEYINSIRKELKMLNLPSPDRLSRFIRDLAPASFYLQPNDAEHEINHLSELNIILLKLMTELGLFKEIQRGEMVIDMDATVIGTKARDSRWSYDKKTMGYQPTVFFVNQLPCYIHGANGNSPARFMQMEIFRMFRHNMERFNIDVRDYWVRSDSASYQNSVVSYFLKHKINFVVATDKRAYNKRLHEVKKWNSAVMFKTDKVQIASIYVKVLGLKEKQRVVVIKSEKPDKKDPKKTILFTRGLITNDRTKSDVEIAELYARRGDAENRFSELKSEFGWKWMPFSNMNENMAYLAVMAMIYLIFRAYKLNRIGVGTPGINYGTRLSTITRNLVRIPGYQSDFNQFKIAA